MKMNLAKFIVMLLLLASVEVQSATIISRSFYSPCPPEVRPSVTASNISTLTSPTFYAWTNSVFTYWTPTNPITFSGISEVCGGGITHSTDTNDILCPLQVSFQWVPAANGANAFEWFSAARTNGQYKIGVTDAAGTYITDLSAYGSVQGTNYYRVKFTDSRPRNITLYLSQYWGSEFAGINLAAGDSILTNSLPAQKLMAFFWDSFGTGYSSIDTNSRWLGGVPFQVAHMNQNIHVFSDAQSGTGLVSSGGTGGTPYIQRTNDVVSLNPNLVIVSGSVNDYGQSTNTIFANATNIILRLKASLPSAHIVLIGNWYIHTNPDATDTAEDVALAAAASVAGVPYLSPVQAGILNAGNYATFYPAGSDGVHPTIAGYTIMAVFVNNFLIQTYGANWSSTI